MGKAAGKSREGRKGSQTGSSRLWVAFLMWESVWEGPGCAYTSGEPSTGCCDLPVPGASPSSHRELKALALEAQLNLVHGQLSGSCFAALLSIGQAAACPARPPGHSRPALRQLHDNPFGAQGSQQDLPPLQGATLAIPSSPSLVFPGWEHGGGGITSPHREG